MRAFSIQYGLVPRLPVCSWQTFSGPPDKPLAAVTDHASAITTTSGRAAILLALKTVGVRPGQRVLVPTYHCPTMISPAQALGAAIMFYPVNDTGGADMAWLSRADTEGVRAMLAAHFFGIPQPMKKLRAWCDARGIALIEDCAHAFFGCSDGEPVGTWGDFAIASLTKFFPLNEGGLLLSARAGLKADQRAPRGFYDEAKTLLDALELAATHERLAGFNRLWQMILRVKNSLRTPGEEAPATPPGSVLMKEDARPMTRTAQWIYRHANTARIIERRRRHYQSLVTKLHHKRRLTALIPHLPDECAPYVMPLFAQSPETLYARLRAAHLPVFRWCQVWPGMPALPGDAGRVWSRHVLQLGCHQDLSDEDIAHIADMITA
ncbi:MAG: hypothetical protein RIR70_1024 [Pseudomonadota bacterium]|jgi:dTDP-4-amino-4,6-dideoxygalactose transaminase